MSPDDLSSSAHDLPLSLGGAVFMDDDADGFLSANETGLANLTVRLMQDGAMKASALTDQEGRYIFANLSPGSYRLEADPVAGSSQTAPGGGYYAVTLADKPGTGLDFGFSSSSRLQAAGPLREHPIMRPAPEEAALWASGYSASAKAVIRPETAAMLAAAPSASFSLLDQLEYHPAERDQGMCGNCWAWAGTG
ncbi:MAG: hypothetical protein HGA68_05020, partial [Methanothrix sp.]|nr:hypothetical protein [Methanothrix sp.]